MWYTDSHGIPHYALISEISESEAMIQHAVTDATGGAYTAPDDPHRRGCLGRVFAGAMMLIALFWLAMTAEL